VLPWLANGYAMNLLRRFYQWHVAPRECAMRAQSIILLHTKNSGHGRAAGHCRATSRLSMTGLGRSGRVPRAGQDHACESLTLCHCTHSLPPRATCEVQSHLKDHVILECVVEPT
jgi:hypothetical protein